MKMIRYLRHHFSRAANDNISGKRLNRALNPPHDNTEEILHGVTVKDPFRPLEKLDAAETAAWTARENKRFEDFMLPAKNAEAEALAFLSNARPKGMSESMP